jgi:hypothetical protein
MILNNVEIIDTEIGKIPVIVNEDIENNTFKGSMIYSDVNIIIQTPTKESCLTGLKNAFEIHIHFWVCKQLNSIKNFNY